MQVRHSEGDKEGGRGGGGGKGEKLMSSLVNTVSQ